MKLGCYLFIAVVGLIGFMNMANTMIMNITTKKQEYGVLQAVGMTNKQLNLCLQLQGLIYRDNLSRHNICHSRNAFDFFNQRIIQWIISQNRIQIILRISFIILIRIVKLQKKCHRVFYGNGKYNG